MVIVFFFFKQKTAYEMRISDWSSDVCSSDLPRVGPRLVGGKLHQTAVAPAAFLNRPLEDSPAETAAAPCSGHAHALDLPAPQAAPRQARNEAELQAGDDRATLLGDGEELVGVALDGGEGVGVAGVERRPRVLPDRKSTRLNSSH